MAYRLGTSRLHSASKPPHGMLAHSLSLVGFRYATQTAIPRKVVVLLGVGFPGGWPGGMTRASAAKRSREHSPNVMRRNLTSPRVRWNFQRRTIVDGALAARKSMNQKYKSTNVQKYKRTNTPAALIKSIIKARTVHRKAKLQGRNVGNGGSLWSCWHCLRKVKSRLILNSA